ncbi:MAG: helix-turn-helix transcriptional regulator [Fibrobacter sp.]|nr:helix-turn-helix transcriptional regulator [Fibrobacter sp.]
MATNPKQIKEACKNTLIHFRGNCGMTQEQLAERSDITRQHISRLETAQKIPRVDTFVVLADGLGVPLPEFFAEFLAQYQQLQPASFNLKKVAQSGPVWKTDRPKQKKATKASSKAKHK